MGYRLLFCRCCSWNRSLDFFRQLPGSKVSTKCLRFFHQHGVKCSRIKHERVLFSDTYSQRKNNQVVFAQPQSTSSAAIGKTSTEKEENLLKEETTDKEADEEEWREQSIDWRKLPQQYMQLSKFRLTGLVVITEMAGYLIAPGAIHLGTFLWAGLGTGLCSGSANAINQWLEVPFDSQMSRTRNRVLVRARLSPLHVVTFGAVTGALGLTILATQVNGLTAALGLSTLLLYTSIYTPMKRLSIVNTWVGSVVGALPPLMGWAACTGGLDIGALLLAGILYSWQFPHFNALSWNLRADYSRAGYRMMCVTDAALCRRVTLRHCVALLGFCTLLPAFDVTTWWLALDSLPLNIWNTYLGYQFYRDSDNGSARRLFRFSLPYLPVLMLLILLHKKTKDEWTEEERVVES